MSVDQIGVQRVCCGPDQDMCSDCIALTMKREGGCVLILGGISSRDAEELYVCR